MKRFTKKYRYPIASAVVVLGVFGAILFSRVRERALDGESIAVVAEGVVREEVGVTGKVKPLERADLSFERGGTIRRVFVSVGERVSRGQSLVALDTRTDELRLAEALAGAAAASAELKELRRGTRPEDLAISGAKYAAAEAAFATARESLLIVLKDAFTRSDSAVRSSVDQFVSNPRTRNLKVNFLVSAVEREHAFLDGRIFMEDTLVLWQARSERLGVSELSGSVEETYRDLRSVQAFLEITAELVNGLTASSGASQTIIDGYRDDVAAARTSINTALTNLASADDVWRKAATALTVEEKNLAKARAGSSAEEIAAAEAAYDKAAASAASIRNDIAEATLRAPFAGVVTDEDATEGERISAYTTLVSVASLTSLDIEANVPEVDIGRITEDDLVAIVFDAFPGETFSGRVSFIDPAETILDGVVNFRIVVTIDVPDERVRSGLTANLTIATAEKRGVLTLPGVALIENDEGTFVRVIKDGGSALLPVVVGSRGSDGAVEILSGLSEGDAVEVVGLRTNGDD